MILRRLYLYLVSAAGLGLLAAGVALLGTTLLLSVFNQSYASDSYYRTQLAGFTAMTLVALPVWGVHFWFARRLAMRDPAERASTIRRLYLYSACLSGAIGFMITLAVAAAGALNPLIDGASPDWLVPSQAGWVAVVFLALWGFHYVIAARDRAAVGESGASATLRRWYMYIVLLVGLFMILGAAAQLLEMSWLRAWHVGTHFMAYAAGVFIAGVAGWGFHALAIARGHAADDRHSTLRALQGFIAVAVSIGSALASASLILYYALAKAIGVTNPGGVATDPLVAVAAPGSALLVYGTAWFLVRRRLARDARAQEGDRQAGLRRLYTNLVALVALATAAIGAGGLLWTLAEQVEAPLIGVPASDWKDPVSLWITLLLVGAVVWLAHWRPSPWAEDRQALSRRLYVWAALLASVLAILGGGVGMLSALLQQLFSAQPKLNDVSNLGFGHYLAVIVVAAAVGVYHWRVLRADAAARPPKIAAALVAAAATPPAAVASVRPSPSANSHARRYVLAITDATEDDVHQALANLPPHASYRLTPAEQGAD
jgi:hypothetical protein